MNKFSPEKIENFRIFYVELRKIFAFFMSNCAKTGSKRSFGMKCARLPDGRTPLSIAK